MNCVHVRNSWKTAQFKWPLTHNLFTISIFEFQFNCLSGWQRDAPIWSNGNEKKTKAQERNTFMWLKLSSITTKHNKNLINELCSRWILSKSQYTWIEWNCHRWQRKQYHRMDNVNQHWEHRKYQKWSANELYAGGYIGIAIRWFHTCRKATGLGNCSPVAGMLLLLVTSDHMRWLFRASNWDYVQL